MTNSTRSGMIQITAGRNLTTTFLARNRFFVSLACFLAVALPALGVFLSFDETAPTGKHYTISQRDRQFHPDALTISVGDIVTIANDDGDLHHHAYVSSRDFNFDSGDQLPGSHTDIVFTVPGQFNVLCGIHPKMRLVVTVMSRNSENQPSGPRNLAAKQ
jgi:plastocyanin